MGYFVMKKIREPSAQILIKLLMEKNLDKEMFEIILFDLVWLIFCFKMSNFIKNIYFPRIYTSVSFKIDEVF